MRDRRSFAASLIDKLAVRLHEHRSRHRSNYNRYLRLECCEHRRMLTTFMVTTSADAPENTPAAYGTLRQAIFNANTSIDAQDTIKFDETVFATGGTILLNGVLSISDVEGV